MEGATDTDLPRIPRVQDTLENVTDGAFGQKNFMEPGLARTVIQEGGEVTGGFLPAGVSAAPQALQTVSRVSKDAIRKAAPTIEKLDELASGIYKQIDDLGVQITPEPVKKLATDVAATLKKRGHNVAVTPKAQGVIDELERLAASGQNVTVGEIDIARRVANAARMSNERAEQQLGRAAIDKIDNFLDALPEDQLLGQGASRIGPLIKEARGFHSRARKSELIEDMFQRAELAGAGLERGLRAEARSLLKNKKKMAGFTKEEQDALREVVRGTTPANIAAMLGRFGFDEGAPIRFIGPTFSAALGGTLGGGVGAVALPALGTASMRIATRLTANNAEFASALVRAGPNANKIARAYMSAVGKRQRSAEDLAALFIANRAPVQDVLKNSSNALMTDAAFIVGVLTSSADAVNDSEAGPSGNGE